MLSGAKCTGAAVVKCAGDWYGCDVNSLQSYECTAAQLSLAQNTPTLFTTAVDCFMRLPAAFVDQLQAQQRLCITQEGGNLSQPAASIAAFILVSHKASSVRTWLYT
jgi:hypothetical protein